MFLMKRIVSNHCSGKELEMIFLSFGIKEFLNWTVCFGISMGLNLASSSLLRKKRMDVYRFSIFELEVK